VFKSKLGLDDIPKILPGVYNGSATYKSGEYTTTDGTVIGDWNRNGWGYIVILSLVFKSKLGLDDIPKILPVLASIITIVNHS